MGSYYLSIVGRSAVGIEPRGRSKNCCTGEGDAGPAAGSAADDGATHVSLAKRRSGKTPRTTWILSSRFSRCMQPEGYRGYPVSTGMTHLTSISSRRCTLTYLLCYCSTPLHNVSDSHNAKDSDNKTSSYRHVFIPIPLQVYLGIPPVDQNWHHFYISERKLWHAAQSPSV